MSATATAVEQSPVTKASVETRLPITVRRRDGSIEEHTVAPRVHRELHLRRLHGHTRGLVEIAAGFRENDGELVIYTRKRADHFLPGGGSGDRDWLERLLAVVDVHVERGEEVFVGPATHACPSADREDILFSNWAWVDMDGPEHLGRLDALLVKKPAAMRVISGGSGGEHAYWPLSRPLPARTITVGQRTIVNPRELTKPTATGGTRPVGYRDIATGQVISGVRPVEWIERSNLRLIHSLGRRFGGKGQHYAADLKCRNRSRLLRLAGTVHGETGEYARLSWLDIGLPAYDPQILFGDLEDPVKRSPGRRRSSRLLRFAPEPLKLIPADVYFWRLAGIELPARGNISCPSPSHPDRHPSCHVSDYVFYCHADHCPVQGTVIDLQSLMEGGPTGDDLAHDKEAFLRAKRNAMEALGVL